MPLNDADRAWIREAIATARERHGRGRLTGFIKDWSGVGAAVAILLFFVLQWSNYIEFKTTTNLRLERIEKTLLPITIQSQLSLPASDFQAALPNLDAAIRTAKQEGVKVSPKVMSDLSAKLADSDSNAPSYWPAAATLISYRSSLLVGSLQNWNREFPRCIEPYENPTIQVVRPDGTLGPKSEIGRMAAQNCYIDLDGRTISHWDCSRCLVKYAGGSLSMKDVKFTDCLFVFDLKGQPAGPDGASVSRTLLASELKDVTIPPI
jgi:hypothetical protein